MVAMAMPTTTDTGGALSDGEREKIRGYIRTYFETVYNQDCPLGLPLFVERRMPVVIERAPALRRGVGTTSDPTLAEVLQERNDDGEPIAWRWVMTWSWKTRAELDAYLLAHVHRHCYVALVSGVALRRPLEEIGAPWRKSARTISRYVAQAIEVVAALYFGERWDRPAATDLPADAD